VYEPPRDILRNISGLDFVEMGRIREYSFCCAAGGGVRVAYPDLAHFAGTERIEEAKTTGAEALVTCCPFCELNFAETIEERKEKIKLHDLTELILQAMGEKSYRLEIER
jgi:heterodisulfide reductase subunit D